MRIGAVIEFLFLSEQVRKLRRIGRIGRIAGLARFLDPCHNPLQEFFSDNTEAEKEARMRSVMLIVLCSLLLVDVQKVHTDVQTAARQEVTHDPLGWPSP